MIAKGSLPMVIIPIVFMVATLIFRFYPITILMVILLCFLLYFFRDPERIPSGTGVLSPADGLVVQADGRNVGIYMNLMNVHVNRAPLDGEVIEIKRFRGSFKPAYRAEAKNNARTVITVKTEFGLMEVTQIAGVLVRRIVCYLKVGDQIIRGQRIGLVRFGSQVEVILPEGFTISASKEDKVKAGRDVIAV